MDSLCQALRGVFGDLLPQGCYQLQPQGNPFAQHSNIVAQSQPFQHQVQRLVPTEKAAHPVEQHVAQLKEELHALIQEQEAEKRRMQAVVQGLRKLLLGHNVPVKEPDAALILSTVKQEVGYRDSDRLSQTTNTATTENDDAKELAMPFEPGKVDTRNTDRGGCESLSWTLRKDARQLEAITGTKIEWPALAKLRRVRAEVALSAINRTKTMVKSQNGYCRICQHCSRHRSSNVPEYHSDQCHLDIGSLRRMQRVNK